MSKMNSGFRIKCPKCGAPVWLSGHLFTECPPTAIGVCSLKCGFNDLYGNSKENEIIPLGVGADILNKNSNGKEE